MKNVYKITTFFLKCTLINKKVFPKEFLNKKNSPCICVFPNIKKV